VIANAKLSCLIFLLFYHIGNDQIFAAINESVSLKFSLEQIISPKSSKLFGEINFDGALSTKLTADYKKLENTSPVCDFIGIFKKTHMQNKLFLRVELETDCLQNEVQVRSKIGPFFIPLDQSANFHRKITLNSDFNNVIIKVKSLSL